ncbi:MAG: hypothetical protein RLZZ401_1440 [Pseudomonadota bacterium]|jgi:hypothetical protein
MTAIKSEIAANAACLVVEEGLEYGPAKRRALKNMGLPARTPLPDNEAVDVAVQAYIAVYCAETQAMELDALRVLAVEWMERLEPFRPHLTGAVWRGTATRLSDIYIQLFCDDSKSAEIALIDHRVDYEPRRVPGFHGDTVEALSLRCLCRPLKEIIGVHLMVYDYDDMRQAPGASKAGQAARGDLAMVRELIRNER